MKSNYFNFAFGAPPSVSIQNYSSLSPPASTTNSSDVNDYIAGMQSIINQAIAAMNNYQSSDPPLASANLILTDINTFINFMPKVLDPNNYNSSGTSQTITNKYFGDFTTRGNLVKWLSGQESSLNDIAMDNAQLELSKILSSFSMGKINFYTNVILPISGELDSSDSDLVRDTFIQNMDGDVTMDDFIQSLKAIAPYITQSQFAAVPTFAAQLILGDDMGAGAFQLPPTSVNYSKPINSSTVSAITAELTSNYNAIASRIGVWLPSNTNSLYANGMSNYLLTKNNTNADQVSQNFITGILNGVESIVPYLKDYSGSGSATTIDPTAEANIVSTAINTIQASVNQYSDPGIIAKGVAAQANDTANSFNTNSVTINTSAASSSSSGPPSKAFWLILLAAGALILKHKK